MAEIKKLLIGFVPKQQAHIPLLSACFLGGSASFLGCLRGASLASLLPASTWPCCTPPCTHASWGELLLLLWASMNSIVLWVKNCEFLQEFIKQSCSLAPLKFLKIAMEKGVFFPCWWAGNLNVFRSLNRVRRVKETGLNRVLSQI